MLRFVVVAHCDGSALLHNRLEDDTMDIMFLIPGNIIHLNVHTVEYDVEVFQAHVAE